MVTIKDVAREAGVSVTTVSHVFSGKRKVASDTAESVVAAANILNYSPDYAARKLATGRSTTIGLQFEVSEDALLLNPVFAQMLMGFAQASAENGFNFALLPTQIHRAFGEGSMAGAIIVDPTPDNPWVPYLVRGGHRVVTMGRYLGGDATSYVDFNHDEVMLEIVKHLVEQGYSRPALLSVHLRLSFLADTESGFQQGCVAAGIPGELVYASDTSDRAAEFVARQLLTRENPPDVIIGAVDHMALGVLDAAEDLGISVPAELGVVGAGDTAVARESTPPLTSVSVDPEQLAREAIKLINEFWLDPGSPDRGVHLPAQLIVRESTERTASV